MLKNTYITICKNYCNKVYYCICVIHILFSLFISKVFFKSIKDNVGFEVISYIDDGVESLNQDVFIKNVTKVYSYIFAVILILSFWHLIMAFAKSYNKNKRLFTLFLSIFFLGFLFILSTYPYFLVVDATNDFTMNYVYAKEFVPMHWHGFFDNVFMCSNMIFFPHPFSLQFIPYFFGSYLIFYCIYFIINLKKNINFTRTFIFVVLIYMLPEIIPVLVTPGRNTTYSIFVLFYFVIFIIDYVKNVCISKKKFFLLVILISIIATWRSEGILFLLFFPFIFYVVYINKKQYIINKLFIFFYFLIFVTIFLLLKLPHDYGMKKYYNKDYLIVNTPMPLSAVFLSENANLLYEGCKNDLKNINNAYPIEYLKKWGGNASLRYNVENGRITRQCGTGFNQNSYIISAYNILFHNYYIWFKKQTNNYLISNGFYKKFYMPSPLYDSIEKYELTDNVIRCLNYTNDYYVVGQNNIENKYPLVSKNKFNKFISNHLIIIYKVVHYFTKQFCKYNKLFITFFILFNIFFAFVKKDYFDFLIAVNIVSVFLAIFVFSPDPHYEYYYATYLSQYLFTIYLFCKWFNKNFVIKGD